MCPACRRDISQVSNGGSLARLYGSPSDVNEMRRGNLDTALATIACIGLLLRHLLQTHFEGSFPRRFKLKLTVFQPFVEQLSSI